MADPVSADGRSSRPPLASCSSLACTTIEIRPPAECRLYGPTGALLREVRPEGEIPVLGKGKSRVRFRCDGQAGIRPRARVTVSAVGEVIEP